MAKDQHKGYLEIWATGVSKEVIIRPRGFSRDGKGQMVMSSMDARLLADLIIGKADLADGVAYSPIAKKRPGKFRKAYRK
jgi:hypothetical protein